MKIESDYKRIILVVSIINFGSLLLLLYKFGFQLVVLYGLVPAVIYLFLFLFSYVVINYDKKQLIFTYRFRFWKKEYCYNVKDIVEIEYKESRWDVIKIRYLDKEGIIKKSIRDFKTYKNEEIKKLINAIKKDHPS